MHVTFEFATQDDCLDRMVPSDLRQLVAERDKAIEDAKQLYGLLHEAQVKFEAKRGEDPRSAPTNLMRRISHVLGDLAKDHAP